MPLDVYKSEDPFENHPLFKTEEQARLEETMDGAEPAVAAHAWPGEETATVENTARVATTRSSRTASGVASRATSTGATEPRFAAKCFGTLRREDLAGALRARANWSFGARCFVGG